MANYRTAQQRRGRFTVGRVSRDFLDKHHPDLALYRMLASRGIRVRIMGGTCLAPGLGGEPGIELLPAGLSLCRSFTGRSTPCSTGPACSPKPMAGWFWRRWAPVYRVVAHTAAGYAEVIEHGASGFD